jgi:hypothetical protein
MARWLLLVLLCSFGALQCGPLRAASPQYERTALQADVDVLVEAFEALHPGLYRYNTPARFEGHVRTLRSALDGERDLRQTFIALSEFAAAIRCGHTYPNPLNQPEQIQHALFEGHDRVPFEFRWIERRMIVTRDLTADHVLARGTEILSIEGIPVSRIRNRLMRIARADGSNDAKRTALLEVQGTEAYETFDVYLPLYFPQVGARQRLKVRAPDSKHRTVDVDALTYAQRLAARHSSADDAQAGWSFDVDDPQIAVLRMPTWALYDSKWDWKAFLDRSFAELDRRKPAALVIDLRDNEGGQDVGDEILPHLIARTLTQREPERRVRYRKVPDTLAPMLDTWDPSFKDWGAEAVEYDSRFYTLHEGGQAPGVKRYDPSPPRYAGRLFVLVGPTNSSATFQFAQQVQRAHLGTLVGRPTGGNQRGINGGAFFFLRLPNTQIEMDLPLIARFAKHAPDAGLVPDLPVKPSAQDVAMGRDAELIAVRQTMRGHDPDQAP